MKGTPKRDPSLEKYPFRAGPLERLAEKQGFPKSAESHLAVRDRLGIHDDLLVGQAILSILVFWVCRFFFRV